MPDTTLMRYKRTPRSQIHKLTTLAIIASAGLLSVPSFLEGLERDSGRVPNVVLIVTDDQGYGGMSCHGNPYLKTPNIDRLYRESVPVRVVPTRAAIAERVFSTDTRADWSVG